jgi:hypothetical protein
MQIYKETVRNDRIERTDVFQLIIHSQIFYTKSYWLINPVTLLYYTKSYWLINPVTKRLNVGWLVELMSTDFLKSANRFSANCNAS